MIEYGVMRKAYCALRGLVVFIPLMLSVCACKASGAVSTEIPVADGISLIIEEQQFEKILTNQLIAAMVKTKGTVLFSEMIDLHLIH